MFSWKKEEKKQTKPAAAAKRPAARNVGPSLFEIPPDVEDDFDDGDDADFEAELLALTGEGSTPTKPAPKPVSKNVPMVDLDSMIAASMRDIPSDEDISDDAEDDPDLLAELEEISSDTEEKILAPATSSSILHSPRTSLVNILEERMRMYEQAEANAKAVGEAAKVRRLNRGLKTLQDLLKKAKAGKSINEEDIPLPVGLGSNTKPAVPLSVVQPEENDEPPIPKRIAPPPPPVQQKPSEPMLLDLSTPPNELVEDEPHHEEPIEEKPSDDAVDVKLPSVSDFSNEVLQILYSRRDEYKCAALECKKAGDNTTALILMRVAKQFEPVIAAAEEGRDVDLSAMPPPPSTTSSAQQQTEDSIPQSIEAPPTPVVNSPHIPITVMESLHQRLEIYKSQAEAAKAEDNASKVRRMGRIIKQYEGAIKLHKTGKPIPYDELPNPPGCTPIPREDQPSSSKPEPPMPPKLSVPKSETSPKPSTSKLPEAPKQNSPVTRQEKTMAFLLQRQLSFKNAAIKAKKKGELQQAKEYLRLMKGFDPLVEAAKCGLPIDMNSIPVAPEDKVKLEAEFEIVTPDDCDPLATETDDVFMKLQEDLQKQVKMCQETCDHFRAMGDVASANRFEHLGRESKRDFDTVKMSRKTSKNIPKFHYETKEFNIIQCNTDLQNNDFQLTVVRGINYNVPNPKEIDTFIKVEFPYPSQDEVQRQKTDVKYDTNNPEYNQVLMLQINRQLRANSRFFKRHSLKLEVWAKGGFLRSSSLFGTAAIKLEKLESHCTLHDSFVLYDGRKPVGGNVEVKIRIRNPIIAKQVEQIKEKWLIIDSS